VFTTALTGFGKFLLHSYIGIICFVWSPAWMLIVPFWQTHYCE